MLRASHLTAACGIAILVALAACSGDKPAAKPVAAAAAGSSDKVAYLSSAELLALMPEVAEADKKLDVIMRQKESQFQGLAQSYQEKVQTLQEIAGALPKAEQDKRIAEITALESRLQQLQGSAREAVEKEREKLYKPILDKANAAIKEVALEQGYTAVLDASAGQILYVDTTRNLMPLVKEKLGIKDEPADKK